MPTIDLSSFRPVPGTDSDAYLIDNAFDELQTLLNGGLDDANIASGKVLDPAKLMQNAATDGQALIWDSSSSTWKVGFPPGYEYAYTEFTSGVSVTATTEAAATTVVTADAVTFDGTADIWVEFFADSVTKGTALLTVVLYDGPSSIGLFGFTALATPGNPMLLRRKIIGPSGTKTYSVRAYVNAGTGTVDADAAGSGHSMPGYIRVSKA